MKLASHRVKIETFSKSENEFQASAPKIDFFPREIPWFSGETLFNSTVCSSKSHLHGYRINLNHAKDLVLFLNKKYFPLCKTAFVSTYCYDKF